MKKRSGLIRVRKFQHQLGSSLILVLLVVAGIITVVFGTQRVTLVQFSQSGREEDNLSAYYAAKAGIEDGLLRYRFNRDAQTQADRVYRYNATTGRVIGEVATTAAITNTPGYQPGHQYYDLSLQFKATAQHIDALGNPAFTPSAQIDKDDALELSGFATDPRAYFLRMAFKFVNDDGSSCTNNSAFVQIQRLTESGAITQYRADRIAGNIYDSAGQTANIQVNGGDLTTSIRFRPFHCGVQYAFATSRSNDGNGVGDNEGPTFDKLVADVTATGYYGSAKRTLLATVDRNTGRLISIYDFNALAGRNVQPR